MPAETSFPNRVSSMGGTGGYLLFNRPRRRFRSRIFSLVRHRLGLLGSHFEFAAFRPKDSRTRTTTRTSNAPKQLLGQRGADQDFRIAEANFAVQNSDLQRRSGSVPTLPHCPCLATWFVVIVSPQQPCQTFGPCELK